MHKVIYSLLLDGKSNLQLARGYFEQEEYLEARDEAVLAHMAFFFAEDLLKKEFPLVASMDRLPMQEHLKDMQKEATGIAFASAVYLCEQNNKEAEEEKNGPK